MDKRLMIKQRALHKPSLLKDYLLDDMSSCSSNGFKSFPRRSSSSSAAAAAAAAASHCCTTIRFLHDIDAKSKQQKRKLLNLSDGKRSRNKGFISKFKSAMTALSRFSLTKMESKKSSSLQLPRSLSKKLMQKLSKNSKWSSADKEIDEWKVFDQYLNCEVLDEYNSSSVTVTTSDDQSLQESDQFTVSEEYDCSSGKNSSTVVVKCDQMKEKNVAVEEGEDNIAANGVVSKDQSTTCSDGGDSTNSSTKKQWSSEEKEQFSPVSVLDCPFDDEDEVTSSTRLRLARIEGTSRKNLMKKINEFESFASLEPVSLAQRFSEEDRSDVESPPLLHSTEHKDFENECQYQRKAVELLQKLKDSISSYGLRANTDKLMLDFFAEKLTDKGMVKYYSLDEEVLDDAEDWIKGTKRCETLLGLGVRKNSEAYICDMEKGGQWSKRRKGLDHRREENEEIVEDLETLIFCDVLDELLVHIISP